MRSKPKPGTADMYHQPKTVRAARRSAGQAMVEFAIVSAVFFMVVFGAIDFGRSIYMYSQMTNAVREGARFAKVHPANTGGIQSAVINRSPGLGLTAANITITCSGSCRSGNNVTVQATLPFTAITQELLGIGPFDMRASATVAIE